MASNERVIVQTASVEQRVDAVQAALDARGLKATQAVEQFPHLAEEQWVPQNGARVVAKAWVDASFRKRLLSNGRAAIGELSCVCQHRVRGARLSVVCATIDG